jgi:hypothetical protein
MEASGSGGSEKKRKWSDAVGELPDEDGQDLDFDPDDPVDPYRQRNEDEDDGSSSGEELDEDHFEYHENSESEEDDGEDEAERPRKRARYTRHLPADLPPAVVELVEARAVDMANKLVGYIEASSSRLRTLADHPYRTNEDDPSLREPVTAPDNPRYRFLFETYSGISRREQAVVEAEAMNTDELEASGRTTFAFGMPAVNERQEPKGRQKLTRGGVNTIVADAFTGKVNALGHTRQGKWTDKLTISPGRYKWDDRARQLLGQLSTLLFQAVAKADEVEAMVVENRVLVSANLQQPLVDLCELELTKILTGRSEVVTELKGQISAQRVANLKATAAALQMTGAEDEEMTEEQGRGVETLAQMGMDIAAMEDDEEADDVQAILAAMRLSLEPVPGGSPEAAADLIHDPEMAGRIITVDGFEKTGKDAKGEDVQQACSHAEQNLVLALVNSGVQTGAQVAGKKRPCTVCWLSLMLVDENGYGVKHGINPGGLWVNTTDEGLHLIAKALGYGKTELIEWIKSKLGPDFRQSVTAEPDYTYKVATDGSRVEEVGNAEGLGGKGLRTDISEGSQELPASLPMDDSDDASGLPGEKAEAPTQYSIFVRRTADGGEGAAAHTMRVGTRLIIGRGSECNVRLNDPAVPERAAGIELLPGSFGDFEVRVTALADDAVSADGSTALPKDVAAALGLDAEFLVGPFSLSVKAG